MAENNEDFIITLEDWRASRSAGDHFCVPGVRQFCGMHGFNFQDFVRNGVRYSQIAHIKNAMLDRVIEVARERNKQENAQ